MKRAGSLLLVVATTCTGLVLGQVSATQGSLDRDPLSRTEFVSPMVLDIPSPDLREITPTRLPWLTRATSPYFCDGVNLEAVIVTPAGEKYRSLPNNTGVERVAVYNLVAHIRVRPSHDRTVSLRVQLQLGDRIVSSTAFSGVDAEEKKLTVAKTDLVVRVAEIEELFASKLTPTLHLVMTVK